MSGNECLLYKLCANYNYMYTILFGINKIKHAIINRLHTYKWKIFFFCYWIYFCKLLKQKKGENNNVHAANKVNIDLHEVMRMSLSSQTNERSLFLGIDVQFWKQICIYS